MLIGNVFQQMYNVVDSIIVGQFIGKEALAAVGASFPVIFTMIAFTIGISQGGSILIAQFYGAKDMSKVKQTIDTLFVFFFAASIVTTAAGVYFSEDIFTLLKLPQDVMPQAVEYLDLYFLGIIGFFGFHGTSSILRGLGDAKTPLYFMIVSSVLNVLLDLLFVLQFGWGVQGVAIATVLSQGIVFVGLILYLNKTHEMIAFRISQLSFDKNIFGHCIRIGLPTGLQQSFVSIGMMALIGIVNRFDSGVLAAYSVAGRIDAFAYLPAMNFSAALTTFVGQNLGANKLDRVRKGVLATLLMTSVISISVSLLTLLFSHTIMGVFVADKYVIDVGARYLMIVSWYYVVFSTMFVFHAVFKGAGDTVIPMFITLFALWVIRIPISHYLSLKIGVEGIWYGIPAAWFCGLLLTMIYYFIGNWKTKVVATRI